MVTSTMSIPLALINWMPAVPLPLKVEFITWEGSIVEPPDPMATGRRWDPTGTLMAGSEGTLGVITDCTI